MKHLVITRMNFEDDQLFDHYFQVMKKTFVPSVNSQKNKNFTLVFTVNPKHVELLKPHFTVDALYFSSFDEIKNYCRENNVEIQTRHDCDDWMRNDYIEKIQELYYKNISGQDKFIIHSKVQKLNFDTGEIHDHATSYANNNFISMFLTLCQKNYENFVYDKNHRFMGEITKNITLLDDGYTRLVIHGKNKLSKISDKDKKLTEIDILDLSIVVPTYDNVEYIEDFINSVKRAKKNYNIEVLIGVDNCETTKLFLRSKFDEFPPYVKFFLFNESLGPYIIRNSLSQISMSDKLLFVDSDDLLHENIITETLNNLQSHDVIRFKFYNFSNQIDLDNIKKENINPFHSIGQLGISKKLFNQYNGFEPWSCGADSEFKMREEGNKLKTKKTDQILYYRRRHDKNLTIKPETNHKSKVRQSYNFEILQRKRKQQFTKYSEITTTNFDRIIDRKNLSEVFISKNKIEKLKTDVLEIKKPQQSIVSDNHIIELSHKKMDYEKINSIFNKSVGYKTNNNSQNNRSQHDLKKNTDLIQKMLPKNKRKFL
jgi:hypothetical protein